MQKCQQTLQSRDMKRQPEGTSQQQTSDEQAQLRSYHGQRALRQREPGGDASGLIGGLRQRRHLTVLHGLGRIKQSTVPSDSVNNHRWALHTGQKQLRALRSVRSKRFRNPE